MFVALVAAAATLTHASSAAKCATPPTVDTVQIPHCTYATKPLV